jgi:hypothetical protein
MAKMAENKCFSTTKSKNDTKVDNAVNRASNSAPAEVTAIA